MSRLVEVVGAGRCGGWPRTSATWRAAWGGRRIRRTRPLLRCVSCPAARRRAPGGEPLGTIVSAGMAGDPTPNAIETMLSCHEIAKKAATYHCPY